MSIDRLNAMIREEVAEAQRQRNMEPWECDMHEVLQTMDGRHLLPIEAARYLQCDMCALRASLKTGELNGRPAPRAHYCMGRREYYLLGELREWMQEER